MKAQVGMDEQEKRESHKNYKERIVRWQQLSIKQLSYTNNLFLGLNLAFLGFLITQIELKIRCNCFLVSIQLIGFLFLGISFLTGILTVLNRLKDFRATHKLVRNKKLRFEHKLRVSENRNISNIESAISEYQSITNKLGRQTWIYLQWQIWTFVIGVFIGIILLFLQRNTLI